MASRYYFQNELEKFDLWGQQYATSGSITMNSFRYDTTYGAGVGGHTIG